MPHTDEYLIGLKFLDTLNKIGITVHPSNDIIYKYTSLDVAKTILNNNSMRFSSPITFNDPFEMSMDLFDFSIKMNFIKKAIESFISMQNPNMSKKELKKMSAIISRDEFLRSHIQTCEKQRKDALILCGSRKNNVTLMWSHYADKHNGVCIGYKMPIYNPTPEMFTLNVKYDKAIIPIQYFSEDPDIKTASLMNWIFTKSHIWSYEEEVRTYVPANSFIKKGLVHYADIPFPKEQFCELYFGVGVSNEQIEEIKKMAQDKNYTIQKMGKMEINKGTFDLICKPL